MLSFNNSSVIKTIDNFSLTEKTLFYIFALMLITSATGILFKQTHSFFETVPLYGGTLNEGMVGYPRYINPILSITDTGRDMTSIIYSGLLREDKEGNITNDLAENYTVSEDGRTYDVYLKKDLIFHDGQPLTADDVVFTIEKAKDPFLKSPEFSNWQGIEVTKIDDHHIQFILPAIYTPFLHNLTLGILPQHIWENLNSEEFAFSQYNTEPIGAGPYKLIEIKQYSGNAIFELKAFDQYALGKPYIENLNIHIYKDTEALEEALMDGEIDSTGGISPSKIASLNLKGKDIKTLNLLRTFAVFFNQNQSQALLNKEVRQALNIAVDRNELIEEVFDGYAKEQYSPVPPHILSDSSLVQNTTPVAGEGKEIRLANARKILEDNGWIQNSDGIMEKITRNGTSTLAFTLTTSDNEELKEAASFLQELWTEIGAKVELEIYDAASLNQNIIRPRKYDALLFGEVVGSEIDLYPFWHSSQRNDPGLNVAMYTNLNADKALQKAREASTQEELWQAYREFNAEVMEDVPAVFLYSPQYIYIAPKNLRGFLEGTAESGGYRFNLLEKSYLEEKKVLKALN